MPRLLIVMLAGCAVTSHEVVSATIGAPARGQALLAALDTPGPIEVTTLSSAEWHVPLSGMLNLDDPKARHLHDREEPIHIYFHALRHPERGLFIIDTGIERDLKKRPDDAAIQGLLAWFMNADEIVVHRDLASYLEAAEQPLAGVFLTHLHLDHVSGMRDVPRGTPIFVGQGEARATSLDNLFVRGTVERALDGQAPLSEWNFVRDEDDLFDGIIDVFGDGSLYALHVPGHTTGSTAYLARTPTGPILFTGDACHTSFGWRAGVEPGSFSHDRPRSRASLERLRRFVEAHPSVVVRLGHQPL